MREIDKYLLRQLLSLFGFFGLLLVLIYWINRAVRLFDQLIADGQSAVVFLEFSMLSLPAIIAVILPIAAFAATIYVTNKMSNDSELTVLRAVGLSSFSMMRPYVVFAIAATLMMMMLTHVLVPISKSRLSDRQAEVAENLTARLLTEGEFLTPAPGITFYLKNISAEGELLSVFLNDATDPSGSVNYSAAKAFLVKSEAGPKLVLIDGVVQAFDAKNKTLSVTKFNDFVFDMGALLSAPTVRKARIDDLPSLRLLATDQSIDATQAEIWFKIHERSHIALITIAAVLIAFSVLITGGFSRFGIWRHVFLAVLGLIMLKMLEGTIVSQILNNNAPRGLIYVPTIVFGAASVALVVWIDRPKRRKAMVAQ